MADYGFDRDLAEFWKRQKRQHAGRNTETILKKQRKLDKTRIEFGTNLTPASYDYTNIKVLNPNQTTLTLVRDAPTFVSGSTTFGTPITVRLIDENDDPVSGALLTAIPVVGSGTNLTETTTSSGFARFNNLTLDTTTNGQILTIALNNLIRVSTKKFRVI